MMLYRLFWSPPSTVRCRQLNSTLLVKLKSPSMPIDGLRPVLHAQRLWWKLLLFPPRVLPKEWLYVSSASLEMHHWIVMLTVGSFNSLSPSLGLYMCRYMDRFSSSPQLVDTWSKMTLPTGLPPSESSRLATFVSPRGKRR